MMQSLAESDLCDATMDFSTIKGSRCGDIMRTNPNLISTFVNRIWSYALAMTEIVAHHLREGQLVIFESTTYPGTTEEVMIPLLEKHSGLIAGKDFYVAYSPEREDPGNPNFNTAKIPKGSRRRTW